MAPAACESASQAVEESDARGSKKPGDVRQRVRKTIGNRVGQTCLFKASGAAKKEKKLLGGYRVDFERE